MDKRNKAYFRKDLIFLDYDFTDKINFFEFIGEKLAAKHIVHKDFAQGLINREEKYPTGLPICPDAVAVPHCDPKYVVENTVSITRFRNKIKFYEMGTIDKEVEVKFAFVLTMGDVQQVPILQDLIALFNDREVMDKLNCYDEEKIFELINTI